MQNNNRNSFIQKVMMEFHENAQIAKRIIECPDEEDSLIYANSSQSDLFFSQIKSLIDNSKRQNHSESTEENLFQQKKIYQGDSLLEDSSQYTNQDQQKDSRNKNNTLGIRNYVETRKNSLEFDILIEDSEDSEISEENSVENLLETENYSEQDLQQASKKKIFDKINQYERGIESDQFLEIVNEQSNDYQSGKTKTSNTMQQNVSTTLTQSVQPFNGNTNKYNETKEKLIRKIMDIEDKTLSDSIVNIHSQQLNKLPDQIKRRSKTFSSENLKYYTPKRTPKKYLTEEQMMNYQIKLMEEMNKGHDRLKISKNTQNCVKYLNEIMKHKVSYKFIQHTLKLNREQLSKVFILQKFFKKCLKRKVERKINEGLEVYAQQKKLITNQFLTSHSLLLISRLISSLSTQLILQTMNLISSKTIFILKEYLYALQNHLLNLIPY